MGDKPSTSGLSSVVEGKPSSRRSWYQGLAQKRVARLRVWPSGPQKAGPRKCRVFESPGYPGSKGGDRAEKKPTGLSIVDAHLIPSFSATKRVAKVIGCETSRSAPWAAASVSS
jgi:hypothetical protein